MYSFGKLKLCFLCNNKKQKGFKLKRKELKWVDNRPKKKSKKTVKRVKVTMTKEERKRYNSLFGKKIFNTKIVDKDNRRFVQVNDYWDGIDDFDFKEDNYHLHLL